MVTFSELISLCTLIVDIAALIVAIHSKKK
jgi:hypothetical protein